MTATIRLLRQLSRALERPMLERQLQGSTHVRFEFLKAWKGLGKHLLQPRTAVDFARFEPPNRSKASFDDRSNQLASAGEVAISRGACDARCGRYFRYGHHASILGEFHRA